MYYDTIINVTETGEAALVVGKADLGRVLINMPPLLRVPSSPKATRTLGGKKWSGDRYSQVSTQIRPARLPDNYLAYTGHRSSAIYSVGYSQNKQEMEITFQGTGRRTYIYNDVPFGTVMRLLAATSLGNFYNTNVRNAFTYQKQLD